MKTIVKCTQFHTRNGIVINKPIILQKMTFEKVIVVNNIIMIVPLFEDYSRKRLTELQYQTFVVKETA